MTCGKDPRRLSGLEEKHKARQRWRPGVFLRPIYIVAGSKKFSANFGPAGQAPARVPRSEPFSGAKRAVAGEVRNGGREAPIRIFRGFLEASSLDRLSRLKPVAFEMAGFCSPRCFHRDPFPIRGEDVTRHDSGESMCSPTNIISSLRDMKLTISVALT